MANLEEQHSKHIQSIQEQHRLAAEEADVQEKRQQKQQERRDAEYEVELEELRQEVVSERVVEIFGLILRMLSKVLEKRYQPFPLSSSSSLNTAHTVH